MLSVAAAISHIYRHEIRQMHEITIRSLIVSDVVPLNEGSWTPTRVILLLTVLSVRPNHSNPVNLSHCCASESRIWYGV